MTRKGFSGPKSYILLKMHSLQNAWSKAEYGDTISQAGKLELSQRQGRTRDGVGPSREAAEVCSRASQLGLLDKIQDAQFI